MMHRLGGAQISHKILAAELVTGIFLDYTDAIMVASRLVCGRGSCNTWI